MNIRLATRADLPGVGELGAMLMATHYAFDPQRFLEAGNTPRAATPPSSAAC